MKVFDCFPFFNEIDLLKIRLELLYEKVDAFIICESNVTYSGIKKGYNFLEHQNEFLPYLDKIKFLKFEPNIENLDFRKINAFDPSHGPWTIETEQRNLLYSFLKDQEASDIAFICDADEVWNPTLADFLKANNECPPAARLQMSFHYYYLNCVGVGPNNTIWRHPFYANIGFLKSNADLSQIRVFSQLPSIANAGWHFSYLGGAKKISEKISSYAHQEDNNEEINNLQHLERCVRLGIDHKGVPGNIWAFHPVKYFPDVIANKMLENIHLVKTTLI
ncbi:hypothetical protein AOC10_09695 [Polynucleobacter asymbioticus]|jgi:beta-1,4-mannosyl-glycoprotein beta-1,4-N-acetylglucosaminyltransferase|uniref:hypothetical protein n=1 Tax=Polynucleobacter asymbioticus TaxID=576611 RepID=UPI0008FB9F91|nr:hypothetical protein [Polynucleobacter asymbioticus]APC06789.1 hypothetical protein AOC10_09695 [Polynucleobacter asymbioticus]